MENDYFGRVSEETEESDTGQSMALNDQLMLRQFYSAAMDNNVAIDHLVLAEADKLDEERQNQMNPWPRDFLSVNALR